MANVQPKQQRVSRAYRVPVAKVRAAQRALGTSTASETIEQALDMVVFRQSLVRGTRALLGISIVPPDEES